MKETYLHLIPGAQDNGKSSDLSLPESSRQHNSLTAPSWIDQNDMALDEDEAPVDLYASIGLRLRGARLGAGFVAISSAVARLGIPDATYRQAESGLRVASDDILRAAEQAFGVSPSYIGKGVVGGPADELAERLARIVGSSDSEIGSEQERARRLRRIREAKGYPTAIGAARAIGWAPSTFSAHEAGGRPIGVDRMIGYCLGFQARPEFGVRGEEPLLDDHAPSWRERGRDSGAVADGGKGSWAWLPRPGRPLDIVAPLLIHEGGMLVVSELPPLRLPAALVGEQTVFAVLEGQGRIKKVSFLSPRPSTSGETMLGSDGRGLVEIPSGSAVDRDPLRVRIGDAPLPLGVLVGSLSIG